MTVAKDVNAFHFNSFALSSWSRTMHPHAAYRQQSQTAWTRIDMLLALYNATVSSLDEGIDLLNRQDTVGYSTIQLKTCERLLHLIDGIDAERSETSARIRDLCVFCIGQIAHPSIPDWTSAREVLATLRDGFEEIRTEGIRLEAEGVIPPLSLSTGHTLLHA